MSDSCCRLDVGQSAPTESRQDRVHVAYVSSESAPTTSGPLIGSTVVSPSATVRDLGVFIDQELTMNTHVQQTASRCFATLRQLRSIRRCIPTSVFHSLVSALVLSRLDYCNSLLIDLPLTHIQRLQSVQNAATRLIFNLRRCDHITDALISLHWLRVPERITFKVATLTYRALHGSAPPYLAPPLNNLTFRLVVGQLSEVVPFLLLEQRCGMACQAKLRRPRRCRCSRTGRRHTCSAAVTKLFDFINVSFPSHYLHPELWSLQ